MQSPPEKLSTASANSDPDPVSEDQDKHDEFLRNTPVEKLVEMAEVLMRGPAPGPRGRLERETV